MDIEGMLKIYNDIWKSKIDEQKLIKEYREGIHICDEKFFKKKQFRTGQAIRLIQNMESSDQTEKPTFEELLRAWKYWFVCVNSYKYFLDSEKARSDFGIDELQKKYKK